MDFQRADIKKPRPYHPHVIDPEPSEWKITDDIDWNKKIIVEVGCGKGDWICAQAKENPSTQYIGIERTKNKSDAMLEKANELSLKNLFTIRADAIALLAHKFPKQSIDELYFLYPNPTPKKKLLEGQESVYHPGLSYCRCYGA